MIRNDIFSVKLQKVHHVVPSLCTSLLLKTYVSRDTRKIWHVVQFLSVKEEARKRRKGDQDRDRRKEKRDREQWSGVWWYIVSEPL